MTDTTRALLEQARDALNRLVHWSEGIQVAKPAQIWPDGRALLTAIDAHLSEPTPEAVIKDSLTTADFLVAHLAEAQTNLGLPGSLYTIGVGAVGNSLGYVVGCEGSLSSTVAVGGVEVAVKQHPYQPGRPLAVASDRKALAETVQQFERSVARCAVLHDTHQGKVMSEANYQIFATLRDDTIPELRKQILAAPSLPADCKALAERAPKNGIEAAAQAYFMLAEELGVPDGGSVVEAVEALIAKADRLAAAPSGWPVTQDPKYTTNGTHIIDRATGEAIPHDEPVFIFRASETNACSTIGDHANRCSTMAEVRAVEERFIQFGDWAEANPQRMR